MNAQNMIASMCKKLKFNFFLSHILLWIKLSLIYKRKFKPEKDTKIIKWYLGTRKEFWSTFFQIL